MAVIAAAAIGAAATIYSAQSSSKSQAAAANAQKEAAALQTLVARELHDHWKSHYQQCDIKMIGEVCATPLYVPQYDAVMGRTRAAVLREFGRARAQVNRSQSIYCVGAFAQQCNFIAGIEAIALVDQADFGFRREETQKTQLDQVRLENIFRWLGLGRNLLSQSNAASIAASAAAQRLGAQAVTGENGWLKLAGFLTSKEGSALSTQIGSRIGSLFGQSTTDAAAVDRAFGQGYTSDSEAAARMALGSGAVGNDANQGFAGSDQVATPQSAVATGSTGSGDAPIFGAEGE